MQEFSWQGHTTRKAGPGGVVPSLEVRMAFTRQTIIPGSKHDGSSTVGAVAAALDQPLIHGPLEQLAGIVLDGLGQPQPVTQLGYDARRSHHRPIGAACVADALQRLHQPSCIPLAGLPDDCGANAAITQKVVNGTPHTVHVCPRLVLHISGHQTIMAWGWATSGRRFGGLQGMRGLMGYTSWYETEVVAGDGFHTDDKQLTSELRMRKGSACWQPATAFKN